MLAVERVAASVGRSQDAELPLPFALGHRCELAPLTHGHMPALSQGGHVTENDLGNGPQRCVG